MHDEVRLYSKSVTQTNIMYPHVVIRAGWRVFSRGKLTVGVGSSSGFLYWNMTCVVPCSVHPSFVYSWKSRLSNANCVNRPTFRFVGMKAPSLVVCSSTAIAIAVIYLCASL